MTRGRYVLFGPLGRKFCECSLVEQQSQQMSVWRPGLSCAVVMVCYRTSRQSASRSLPCGLSSSSPGNCSTSVPGSTLMTRPLGSRTWMSSGLSEGLLTSASATIPLLPCTSKVSWTCTSHHLMHITSPHACHDKLCSTHRYLKACGVTDCINAQHRAVTACVRPKMTSVCFCEQFKQWEQLTLLHTSAHAVDFSMASRCTQGCCS